jgi:hypothetical protein
MNKLPVYDQRMILLMRHCIDSEKAENQKDFLESIGFNPASLKDVKSGARSFAVEQMVAACKKYKVNMNWLTGFSSDMRMAKSRSALQNLKDSVRVLESELK